MAVTAKFQADFSSFLDAINKAEVELVDFGKGAEKVEKQLNKMVDNFSGRKLIQETTLIATALEQAGGASTLTAKELDRVGAKAAEAAEKMKKLGVDVPPGIQKLADAFHESQKESDSAFVSFGKLVASYVTAQAIIAGLKAAYNIFIGAITQSITAAAEAEKAHNQLVAALKTQGTAVPSVVKAYGDYATALQKTTVFQDDAIESATKMLVLVGNVMPRDMEKALKATTDLASGLGIDLTSAATLVAKAAEGNTTALKRSGIVIDETKAKAQGFGFVLDEIEKKFGGQAAAAAATYSGRLQQLSNTWNNVEESIGRVITQNATVLRAFDLINQTIDEQTGELKDNATATLLVSDAVILLAKAFANLLVGIDYIQTGSTLLMGKLRDLGASLGNIAIFAAQAGKGFAIAALDFKSAAIAQVAIDNLKDAVKELGDRNAASLARSNDFGNKLQEMAGKATALTAELEKTRGKTVAFSQSTSALGMVIDTIDGSIVEGIRFYIQRGVALEKLGKSYGLTQDQVKALGVLLKDDIHAWERHTRAIDTGEDAIKQAAAALKLFENALADVTSHQEIFGRMVETIDGTVLEGIRYYIARGASLEKLGIIYGLTAGQVKALADQFKFEESVSNATAKAFGSVNAQLTPLVARFGSLHEAVTGLDDETGDLTSTMIESGTATFSFADEAAYAADQTEGLRKALEKIRPPDFKFGEALRTDLLGIPKLLQDAFTGGGGIAGALKAIAVQLGVDFGKQLKQGITDQVGSGFNAVTGKAAAATGAVAGLGTALSGASAKASIASTAMAGIAVGATAIGAGATVAGAVALGAATAGIGTAAVAAYFGLKKLFSDTEKKINPVRQAFVDMAGGLDALNKKAQEAGVSLDAMLNAKNPQQYEKAINDLNAAFARQAQHVKDVGDGLKIAAAGTNALAGSLLEPLKAMRDALGKLGEEDVAGDLTQRMAKALQDVQPAFEHLGQYVAATFAAQIHEGASAFDAFQSLAPAFAALQDGVEQLGLTSTGTIKQLLKIQGVVGANKDVSDSVQALSDVYDGLTQAGYLTKDLFEAFAEDISYQFDLLVSRGADGTTALQLMQPELQKLWEGQQKFGEITDESTKALLDQAEKQGLVGEDMKNVNDKILDVLLSIADVFGAKLPKSLQAMVDQTKKAQVEAQKALDAIHAPDITIGVHFNVDQAPDFSGGFEPIQMARGGSGTVDKPTLFLAGEAGREKFAFGDAVDAKAGMAGSNMTPDWARELIDTLRGLPRTFRDASFGAAV